MTRKTIYLSIVCLLLSALAAGCKQVSPTGQTITAPSVTSTVAEALTPPARTEKAVVTQSPTTDAATTDLTASGQLTVTRVSGDGGQCVTAIPQVLWQKKGPDLEQVIQCIEKLPRHWWEEEEPALIWEGHDQGEAHKLLITFDGSVGIGCCEGLFLPIQGGYQGNVWAPMQARFASFQYETRAEKLIFKGKGQEIASPAWQRSIAAWARYTYGSLYVGHACASCPTKFYWTLTVSQEPEQCAALVVTEFGTVSIAPAPCQVGDLAESTIQPVGDLLTTDEWEQFDTWLYNRSPLRCRHSNLPDDDFDYSASFAGSGVQPLSDDELLKLVDWTRQVYSRLTRGRPGWPDAENLDWSCTPVK